MATTAAPAGGARNGAGPEWGGFEENIQVMAPRHQLPATGGPAMSRSVLGIPPLGLEVRSIYKTLFFGSSCTLKSVD